MNDNSSDLHKSREIYSSCRVFLSKQTSNTKHTAESHKQHFVIRCKCKQHVLTTNVPQTLMGMNVSLEYIFNEYECMIQCICYHKSSMKFPVFNYTMMYIIEHERLMELIEQIEMATWRLKSTRVYVVCSSGHKSEG